jgi:F-type H+-transporting ATPase subunit delta
MQEDRKVAKLLYTSLKAAKSEAEEQAVIASFMTVLKKTHTESRGAKIIELLETMLEQSENVLRPIVTTATPLTQRQSQALIEKLKKQYNASAVHLHQKVDPTVIGGISIKIDDMLYDATLKNTLHTLHNTLTQ